MGFFSKKTAVPGRAAIPPGFTADDIKVERSTCTGEATIGFYDRRDKKLRFSELVRSKEDIAAFYEKYGAEVPEEKGG